MYILSSIWVLRTPNTGQNLNLNAFCAKKLKKARSLHQNAGLVFYNTRLEFWYKIEKNIVLLNFATNFLLFSVFSFLLQKKKKCRFRPAFGVHSTQALVKIYNRQDIFIYLLILFSPAKEGFWIYLENVR